MRRTILITGGAGFIGSNFVRHVLEKYTDYSVVVLDALTYAGNGENFNGFSRCPRFTFWYGNVRNPEIVNELVADPDSEDTTTGRLPQLARRGQNAVPARVTGIATEISR